MPLPTFQNIELPKDYKADFQLLFFPQIKSNQKDHRLQLRQSLVQSLQPMGLDSTEEKALLNLNHLPSSTKFSISLSHSPGGSVVFTSTKSSSIGVDLEVEKRISKPVLKRISVDDEFKNCPKDFDLFTSKEACWKAANKIIDVPTLSHIETFQWQTQNDPWWHFSAKANGQLINGTGFTCRLNEFFLSFFVMDSTFVMKHRQR